MGYHYPVLIALISICYYFVHKSQQPIPSVYFDEFEKDLKDLSGQVVAITGTTSGTGYVAAKTTAQKGAKVLLLNRKSSRFLESLKNLREEVPGANFVAIECDLQDFENVKKCTQVVRNEVKKTGLDVLCLNAGVMALEDKPTKDGYDVQMQTNHLSHFLLTKELFPALEKAAQKRGEARVVSHSSEFRKMPDSNFNSTYYMKKGGQLGGNEESMLPFSFSGPRWERYHQTKLANCVFTYALHDRIKAAGSKVKACVAHPGAAATSLSTTTASGGGMGSFTTIFINLVSQSAEDGSMGILKCMAGKEVNSGDFYGPTGITGPAVKLEPEDFLYESQRKDMLWKLSEDAVGKFKI